MRFEWVREVRTVLVAYCTYFSLRHKMGCLRSKSRIPPEEPGRTLLNTGIKEFDIVFKTCENAIRVLEECKSRLDYAISDFVKALGADKHYEHNSDMKQIVKMMLAVLAVEGKGNFEVIQVMYSHESPFIEVNLKKLRRPAKKMMSSYYDFTSTLNSIPEQLGELHGLNALVQTISRFPSQIALKTEEYGFHTQDKISSIRATTSNHRKVMELPDRLQAMDEGIRDCEAKIIEACERAQVPPESDKLVSRGVQGAAEGLRQPRDIITKFWPFTKFSET